MELEVFGYQIANIPGPDIAHSIAGRPASDYVVDGAFVYDDNRHFYCHAMSLDNGLELLKDLKEL
ncbi:MAG: hypothetical protein J3R72DRAFT_484559 [Linnemannia gamsii]|nr:MAG: hypothetical protein J3R72DRAFT_484559 [Linnemannia gamsii]